MYKPVFRNSGSSFTFLATNCSQATMIDRIRKKAKNAVRSPVVPGFLRNV